MTEGLLDARTGNRVAVTESARMSYQAEITRCLRKIEGASRLGQANIVRRNEEQIAELTDRLNGKPKPPRVPRRREHWC